MFWRRVKPKDSVSTAASLNSLASHLGVERRFSPRIFSPPTSSILIPKISYASKAISVRDISIGGCCLIDQSEILGPQIGTTIELTLTWPDCEVIVSSRIVARVDHSRHIQFLDLPQDKRDRIQSDTEFGVRAMSMRQIETSPSHGLQVNAIEMWNSTLGDSLVIERDLHCLATLSVSGHPIHFYRQAWPTGEKGKPISIRELHEVNLFLSNITSPSDIIISFRSYVDKIVEGAE